MNLMPHERLYKKRVFLAGALFNVPYVAWSYLCGHSAELAAGSLLLQSGLCLLTAYVLGSASPKVCRLFILATVAGFPLECAVAASLTGGTQSALFHTLWAIPLMVVLVLPKSLLTAVTIILCTLACGTVLHLRDGSGLIAWGQWTMLTLTFFGFAVVCARSARRHQALQLVQLREAEAQASMRANQQAAVAALGREAVSLASAEDMGRRVVCTVAQTVGLTGCSVLAWRDGDLVELASLIPPDDLDWYTHIAPVIVQRCYDLSDPISRVHEDPQGRFGRKPRHYLFVNVPGSHGPAGALIAWSDRPNAVSGASTEFVQAAAATFGEFLARREAEVAQKEREQLIAAVFESASDAFLVADDDGVFVDANAAACALMELPREQLLGRHLSEFVSGELRERVAAAWKGAQPGDPSKGEYEMQTLGGKRKLVEFATVLDMLPGKHLFVVRDITDRKAMESRLLVADRMVSVGTLAAGVAHELNNPLAFVRANLEYVIRQLETDSVGTLATPGALLETCEALREALTGADRMRVIVRDMKTFSRSDDEAQGTVDLFKVLESCVSMASNELKHRARLEQIRGPVPMVKGNSGRLSQVFLNLLVNAAQALPAGDAQNQRITVETRTLEDGRACITVQDTGAGIAPEHLGRIFDPFFTTKPVGIGTGLGLSICHNIVHAHGGEISVESELGRGTTVRVVLPASPADEDLHLSARSVSSAGALPPPRARLLVVDDEPSIGATIRRIFADDHEVTVAASAAQALERIREEPDFDLVICDLLMPQMTGMDLYRSLEQLRPQLADRFIFLTGGAFTTEARQFLDRCPAPYMEKPFTVDSLKAMVSSRVLFTAGPSPSTASDA